MYTRENLDSIVERLLGGRNFNDIITDEALVLTYEYNYQEPRLYTKYFSEEFPVIYDIPIHNATGASAAAPTYFDP